MRTEPLGNPSEPVAVSTAPFIDPRVDRDPPCRVPVPPPAATFDELEELHALCRHGKVYAVEAWIRAGRPLWSAARPKRRTPSAFEIAVDTNQEDLALLLLANGFPFQTVLDDFEIGRLLWDRKERFFHLLLAWGLDILRVTPRTILETYDPALFDRYEAAGGDLTREHALAEALGAHGSNRPGYGWARHRQAEPRIARELAIALDIAVRRESERTVALLLWAGADPHRSVPYVSIDAARRITTTDDPEDEDDGSPVETAVMCGQPKLLARMHPDPSRDDFDRLWANVVDAECAAILARHVLPADWSRTVLRNCHRAVAEYTDRWRARRCLEHLFGEYGARLQTAEEREIGWLRRDLLRSKEDSDVRWLLGMLRRPEHCDPAVFSALVRTTGMRARCRLLHVSTNPAPASAPRARPQAP